MGWWFCGLWSLASRHNALRAKAGGIHAQAQSTNDEMWSGMTIKPRRLLRWLYELTLSLNVAWLAVRLYIYQHPTPHFPLEAWIAKVYNSFRTFEPPVVVGQALLSVLLAVLIFG